MCNQIRKLMLLKKKNQDKFTTFCPRPGWFAVNAVNQSISFVWVCRSVCGSSRRPERLPVGVWTQESEGSSLPAERLLR